jgi:hypothetical protein
MISLLFYVHVYTFQKFNRFLLTDCVCLGNLCTSSENDLLLSKRIVSKKK